MSMPTIDGHNLTLIINATAKFIVKVGPLVTSKPVVEGPIMPTDLPFDALDWVFYGKKNSGRLPNLLSARLIRHQQGSVSRSTQYNRSIVQGKSIRGTHDTMARF